MGELCIISGIKEIILTDVDAVSIKMIVQSTHFRFSTNYNLPSNYSEPLKSVGEIRYSICHALS